MKPDDFMPGGAMCPKAHPDTGEPFVHCDLRAYRDVTHYHWLGPSPPSREIVEGDWEWDGEDEYSSKRRGAR